jgi:hypothetical protein
MRLDAFIICKSAVANEGLIDLTGIGIDTFSFDAFPGNTQIPVFVRAVGPHDTREHHLIVQLRDANDQMQSESMIPIMFGTRSADLPDGWEVRTMHVFGLNATFNQPGAFLINVSIDSGEPISQPVFATAQ